MTFLAALRCYARTFGHQAEPRPYLLPAIQQTFENVAKQPPESAQQPTPARIRRDRPTPTAKEEARLTPWERAWARLRDDEKTWSST